MSDLITVERAKAQVQGFKNCDTATVAAIVSACSGVIENYCNRTFAKATYDELYHGTGTQYLFVNNPPITTVNAVRTGLQPGIYIQYTDSANTTQAATIEVTSIGVVLKSLYNNSTTTNTFTYASYPTFGALATAVNLLSNWKATVSSQFQYWQTSELAITPATFSARNISVPLLVYWWSLGSYRVNYDLGEIQTFEGFTPGYHNYRINYVGGYDDIPEPIQQACAELVQLTFGTIGANPIMQSETLDKYSYTKNAQLGFKQLSATSMAALNQYIIHRVARYK